MKSLFRILKNLLCCFGFCYNVEEETTEQLLIENESGMNSRGGREPSRTRGEEMNKGQHRRSGHKRTRSDIDSEESEVTYSERISGLRKHYQIKAERIDEAQNNIVKGIFYSIVGEKEKSVEHLSKPFLSTPVFIDDASEPPQKKRKVQQRKK